MASIQAASATQTFLASPEDAIILMEAARQGLIPRTTRRLTRTERADLIEDGSVFIFEEQETQMQRWTDGRRWSCSRVMGEFLAYDEVVPCGGPTSKRGGGGQTCRLENGLIKQSFALAFADHTMLPKKFHIISYSRSSTMQQWKRPSQVPQFAELDLSPWGPYAPAGSVSPSSAGGGSSSKPATSRSASGANGKGSQARQQQSLSFTFHPNALASSSSSSATPVPSTAYGGQSSAAPPPAPPVSSGCPPPKVEPRTRSSGGVSTRSTSPTSLRSPPSLRLPRSRASSPSAASLMPYDRHPHTARYGSHEASSAAAASLLGLGGGGIKREPQSSSVSGAGSRLSSPRRSRSPPPARVYPYQQQFVQPPHLQPSHVQQPHHAQPSLSAPLPGPMPSHESHHRAPHPYPYQARPPLDAQTTVPPPVVRPPWAPSTLGQEDKRMLGCLPFRI